MLNHVDDAKRLEALALVRDGPAVRPRPRAGRERPGLPGPLLPPDARHDRPPRQPATAASARTRSTGSPSVVSATMQLGTHLDALATCRSATAATTAGPSPSSPARPGVTRLGRRDRPADRHARAGSSTSPRARRRGDVIAPDDLGGIDPEPGDAVLFHTGWGAHWDDAERLPRRRARARAARSPSGSRRAASRSPAATPGATAPCPPRTRTRPFEVPQILNVRPRRLRRREPRPVRARRRRRARSSPCPHPPQAPRRHRRLDLPDRPRLRRSPCHDTTTSSSSAPGAGGGTLAHRLAPTGKRILLLERGGYLPARARELGHRGGLPQGALPHRARSGSTRTASPSARTSSTSSAATRSSTGRSCSACASATSARSATTAASPRRGRSPTTTSSPTTPRPRSSTSCTARRGEDPTEPPRSGPFPYPAVSHEPRIQQLPTTSRATGHQPFHLPVGVDLDESDPEARPLRALRPLRRLPVPDRRQGGRARALRAPGAEHPNVTLRTHAKVERLETDASRRDASPASSSTATASEERYSADVVVVSCGAANSAALLLNSASDQHPNGLANCSDVVGRHYMAHINSGVIAISQDAEPDEVPEDARHQRLLLGRRRLRASRSATSRCSPRATATSCAAARRGSRRGLALDYVAGTRSTSG